LDDAFGEFFDEVFGLFSGESCCCSCEEDEDGNCIIEVDVPGFDKEDLSVEIHDGILTIKGEKGKRKISLARAVGFDIKEEETQARVEKGVLQITLTPRAPVKVKKKVIEVK